MSVILMHDGGWHAVPDSVGQTVANALRSRAKVVNLEPTNPEPFLVKTSAISEIMSDEKFAIHQHRRAGDRQCLAGFWHARGEQCAHTIPAMPRENQVEMPNGPRVVRPMAEWKREVLSLNSGRIKQHPGAKVGLIKTEAEFKHFKATGEWPEYLPPSEWAKADPMYAR